MNPYKILLVILAYFSVLLLISIITSRKADSRSFFIGNRQSEWYLVAIGMIGASLSGITFISVPGWVITSKFYYMQMVLGYLLGYAAIVYILLPLYYRLNLTSIYTYLNDRFGRISYKTGAVFFLISRIIGASFRLYIVASVLQVSVFDKLQVPFVLTICLTLAFIYVYTFRGGIKTIVWTDTLQTLFMLAAVTGTIIFIARSLDFNFSAMVSAISSDEHSAIFNFTEWKKANFFVKQFLSGAFITIVMTGLDQDMMQKNLSCRSLEDAQKNMRWYSLMLVPVNLLFLSLGILLIIYASVNAVPIPEKSDDLYPVLATGGYLPIWVGLIFILGLIAAAYSSADSALTALTTSVTIDIFEATDLPEKKIKKLRWKVHITMSLILGLVIFIFRLVSNEAVISSLFKAAGYTYGPLLGLFAFGLFTRWSIKDKWVPLVAILAPLFSYLIKIFLETNINTYKAGYEILVVNGFITFIGLLILINEKKLSKTDGLKKG
ncbi:MAG: sodium:solute symporter [Bacteroidales bacterium]|nr:sodium:solute symporter [Bacteroidales bacterium]